MKKILAVVMVVIFASSNAAFAANVTLSDKQLDQVAAGDWVVLPTGEEEEGVSVADVYSSNNTLDLSDESQTNIQAVSNANVVDSAVAVETNIASVTGEFPINGNVLAKNEANVSNLSPADSSESASANKGSSSLESSSASNGQLNYASTANARTESNYKLDETLDILATYDSASAEASASETDCSKGCSTESVSASASTEDLDFTLDYDKHVLKHSFSEETSKSNLDVSWSEESNVSEKEKSESSCSRSSRRNLGENNHLNMKGTAQEQLQAVSNLNAVGAGAAVQTNIASNVGLSGLISGTNISTVANGF